MECRKAALQEFHDAYIVKYNQKGKLGKNK